MSAFAPPESAAPRAAETAKGEHGERARQDATSFSAGPERAAADAPPTPWQERANGRADVRQLRSLAADANAGPHAHRLGRQQAQLNARRHSAAAPVQRYFSYGPKKFVSAQEVVDAAEGARPEFKRENLGSAEISKMKNKAAKKAILEERWQALQNMAASDQNWGTISKDTLKNSVASYINQQKLLASDVPAGMAKTTGKATVSVSAMLEADSTEGLPEDLKALADTLIDSGRAFPKKNILKTAKGATGANGAGFYHELALAAELLDSGDVMIQVGVVASGELKDYLGFEPAKSATPVLGFVGGDVTVWKQQPESAQAGGQSSFIQAKTANKGTVKNHVLEASNQLAGLTASGDPVGKQADREFSMTGPRYEGAIFVTLIDTVDPATLAGYAATAIAKNPKYVSRVVFKYALDSTFLEVTPTDKEGTLSKFNPLLSDRPEFEPEEESLSDEID